MSTTAFPTSSRAAFWLPPVLTTLLLLQSTVFAYPPALPHTFYGMIRDELGNPLPAGATITLESASGIKVYGVVSGLVEPGVNYRLRVPLDAGLLNDNYKPTALNPAAPFKIKITVGQADFLPIEMSHDFSHMGEPGKSTLLNLSLGVDSNGDGLPDAWQRRINSDINKVSPNDDADHDGLSNLQEYLAGTYAYDPKSGFSLAILRLNNGAPVLGFTTITGRAYTLLGATEVNSTSWTPVQFRVIGSAADSAPISSYLASDVRPIQVEAVSTAGQPVPLFFKLMLE